MIGLFILGIILLPLIVIGIVAVSDSKRTARVGAMFTGAFLLQIAAMVMGMLVFATILKFIII